MASAKFAPEVRRHLRNQLRASRAQVLRDAEAYAAVVQVVELIGRLAGGTGHGMRDLEAKVVSIANDSDLAVTIPSAHSLFHVPFVRLYEFVRESRNSAIHEGALARNLSSRSIELALVLEDALMRDAKSVGDYMTRGVLTAEHWQPLSYIRQSMLAHSYSYLPALLGDGPWRLVSDHALAVYLRDDRKRRLGQTLEVARHNGLQLTEAIAVGATDPIDKVQREIGSAPILVTRAGANLDKDLVGILTAFDLL